MRDAAKNSVIDGLSFDDCRPITGDGLRTPVLWGDEAQTRRKLTTLADKVVQLEFKLTNASLFSFDFADVFEQEPASARQ